jgi:hypothetical protein
LPIGDDEEHPAVLARVPAAHNPGKIGVKHAFTYVAAAGGDGLRCHVANQHKQLLVALQKRLEEAGENELRTDEDESGKGQARGKRQMDIHSSLRRVGQFPDDSTQQRAFDRLMAVVVIKCNLPFSIVDNPTFRFFVSFLNSRYEIELDVLSPDSWRPPFICVWLHYIAQQI